jgi:hypothetical protein
MIFDTDQGGSAHPWSPGQRFNLLPLYPSPDFGCDNLIHPRLMHSCDPMIREMFIRHGQVISKGNKVMTQDCMALSQACIDKHQEASHVGTGDGVLDMEEDPISKMLQHRGELYDDPVLTAMQFPAYCRSTVPYSQSMSPNVAEEVVPELLAVGEELEVDDHVLVKWKPAYIRQEADDYTHASVHTVHYTKPPNNHKRGRKKQKSTFQRKPNGKYDLQYGGGGMKKDAMFTTDPRGGLAVRSSACIIVRRMDKTEWDEREKALRVQQEAAKEKKEVEDEMDNETDQGDGLPWFGTTSRSSKIARAHTQTLSIVKSEMQRVQSQGRPGRAHSGKAELVQLLQNFNRGTVDNDGDDATPSSGDNLLDYYQRKDISNQSGDALQFEELLGKFPLRICPGSAAAAGFHDHRRTHHRSNNLKLDLYRARLGNQTCQHRHLHKTQSKKPQPEEMIHVFNDKIGCMMADSSSETQQPSEEEEPMEWFDSVAGKVANPDDVTEENLEAYCKVVAVDYPSELDDKDRRMKEAISRIQAKINDGRPRPGLMEHEHLLLGKLRVFHVVWTEAIANNVHPCTNEIVDYIMHLTRSWLPSQRWGLPALALVCNECGSAQAGRNGGVFAGMEVTIRQNVYCICMCLLRKDTNSPGATGGGGAAAAAASASASAGMSSDASSFVRFATRPPA